MNFDEAIAAHASWKIKLKNYLINPNKSLSADIVSKDNLCELGHWIYTEGEQRYGTLAEFINLKQKHAHFHICAGEIIKKAEAGQNISEDLVIGSESDFSQASVEITDCLLKLKRSQAA